MRNTVIDISWLNGKWKDWPLVTPITGVVIKASEGIQIDPYCHLNAPLLNGQTRVSLYHYFRPCRPVWARYMPWEDWIDAQVHVFCLQYRYAGIIETTLPSFLDLEDADKEMNSLGIYWELTGKQRLERVKRWLEGVAKELNIIPGLYVGVSYWKSMGGENALWAANYPLIIAQWPWDALKNFKEHYLAFSRSAVQASFPKAPLPWKHCDYWQWTGYGDPDDVPGHPTGKLAVDMYEEWTDPPEEEPVPPADNLYTVNINLANIRSGPGETYSKMGTVARGIIVRVKREQNHYSETELGWIYSQFLTKV